MSRLRFVIVIIYLSSKNVAALSALVPDERTSKLEAWDDEDPNIPQESYRLNSIVPVVKCPAGTFRGSLEYTRGGKRYFLFQSIPYAEPPRRFEPAILKAPMKDEYDATTEPPVCPQIPLGATDFAGQEDCLYLSVSKPDETQCRRQLANGKLLPVLFWIHQGAYINSNGSFYKGTYLLDDCVVLVTFNYRLGALGFLTTEDNVIPGNLGLKDQVLALKWTNRNIKYFLGDPKLLTIGGSSAGASAVTHHICSPASSGLFSRAIAMSGAILEPWGVTEKPRKFARRLARRFNCFDNSSVGIKSCLLKLSAQDIVYKQISAAEFSLRFTPVIEPVNALSPFQNAVPYHLLKTGRINRVPFLTGFVQDEGIAFGAPLLASKLVEVVINVAFSQVAPVELFYADLNIPYPEVKEISSSISSFYFNYQPIGEKTRQNFMNMISDRGIVQGIYEVVQVISRYVPTYIYVNTYKGGVSQAQIDYGYRIPVITHIDDEQYIFEKFKLWLPGTEQYEYSKDMLELWTNFMRSGRPSGRLTQSIPWNTVNFQDPVYRKVFNLDYPPKIVHNLWRRRTKFWRGLGLYKYEFAELRVPTSKSLCWSNLTCEN